MKHLTKVIAIAAVAAMSVCSLSAYAAPAQNKVGQMQAKQIALKTQVKEQHETKMGIKEKAPDLEELKAELAAKLEAGEITQEEYDKAIAELAAGKGKMGGMRGKGMKGEKPVNAEKPVADENAEKPEKPERSEKPERIEKVEMTEEEKAAKVEEIKADLVAKLESGEITQEEYDKVVAKIEAGDFIRGGKGGRDMKGHKPGKVEMTEEEKTAKVEEIKANLAAKLEAGEISQEEYDEVIAAINEGEYKVGGKGAIGKFTCNLKYK